MDLRPCRSRRYDTGVDEPACSFDWRSGAPDSPRGLVRICLCLSDLDLDIAVTVDRRALTGIEHGRRGLLLDDCRALEAQARGQLLPPPHRNLDFGMASQAGSPPLYR